MVLTFAPRDPGPRRAALDLAFTGPGQVRSVTVTGAGLHSYASEDDPPPGPCYAGAYQVGQSAYGYVGGLKAISVKQYWSPSCKAAMAYVWIWKQYRDNAGAPLRQSQILRDGDRVEVGPARLLFRAPPEHTMSRTVSTEPAPAPPTLTRRERDVLDLLCRPFTEGGTVFPEPPSVRRLASQLGLTESAVKKHLANLYKKFDLVTNEERRRTRPASEAVRRGVFGPPS